MLDRVSDVVVCLGCGLIVGADSGWGCTCPPPGAPPASRPASARGPFRTAPEGTPCPRCAARLTERALHDVEVFDCDRCLGLFLDRATIEKLESPGGQDLRLAFPKRPRSDADRSVRYLGCPICQRLMNRTNFARMSGVIVDFCKEHGVWFDAGEVNAVIEFVEQGGLERARREAAERAAERARLVAQRHRDCQKLERAWGYRPSGEVRFRHDDVTRSLIDLLMR
jgi:Zn-finger nucleic acid-binding protein